MFFLIYILYIYFCYSKSEKTNLKSLLKTREKRKYFYEVRKILNHFLKKALYKTAKFVNFVLEMIRRFSEGKNKGLKLRYTLNLFFLTEKVRMQAC